MIWISPYKLQFKRGGANRSGFLIKMQTDEFVEGYADCFPWPEFGDPSVEACVELIKRGESSPLLAQSLHFAKIDGLARAQKKSLLGEVKCKNHALLYSRQDWDLLPQFLELGFDCFKMKCGANREAEQAWLNKVFDFADFKVRLDFNFRFSNPWFDFLNRYSDRIEYVEDPSTDLQVWKEWPGKCEVALARDQFPGNLPESLFQVQIIKPAKQGLQDYSSRPKIFSSYLDHPVGQSFAFWQALQSENLDGTHGLLSHFVYEDTAFSQALVVEGPWLQANQGWGIGFDDLLKEQEWIALH
ncbi:MAG: hypothetical protein KDD33_08300 [Bdellovibrionales bacterium]|nr:hypothetical protein [Bdellovibrionales bacterium]